MSKKRIIDQAVVIALSALACGAYAQEKTLKDWGALNQDVAFETKKKELNELRQKNLLGALGGVPVAPGTPTGAAPTTGTPMGPVVLPVTTTKRPASAGERPQLRLRAVLGVNDRLRGIFLRPTGEFIHCGVGCGLDGWTVSEMNYQGAQLRKGKKIHVVPIDPLVAPRMVEVEQGVSGGSRNQVRSEPLPNPRIIAPQAPVSLQVTAAQANR